VSTSNNSGRKSLKLEDEKNVLSKIYNSVKIKKKSGALDATSLDQLDEMWRKKDEEDKTKTTTTTSLSYFVEDCQENNNDDDNKNTEDEYTNPRVLKRKDSLTSLPNYVIRKQERKQTSGSSIALEGGTTTTTTTISSSLPLPSASIYRSKRANSDKTEVTRKMEQTQLNKVESAKPGFFERERSRSLPIVCSRLPSSLLPHLVMDVKRPRPSSPTSPTMKRSNSAKSPPPLRHRTNANATAMTTGRADLQKMKDIVIESGF